jgi:ABC-type glutathione transport system ATPase component
MADPVPTGEPIARLDNVIKRYNGRDGQFNAVDEVSLRVERGERLAIIGESGSGKSTTARLLLGLIRRDGGTVSVLGQDWDRLKPKQRSQLRGRIGAVFQEPIDSLDPMMQVGSIIAEPLIIHRSGDRLSRDAQHDKVEAALARVGLPAALLNRRPAQLSGGQAQRVSIARALINNPELLILDEPTSALDVSVQAQILDLLEEIGEQDGLSWVFITHDLGVARSICQNIVVMRRGRIVERGRADDVLQSPSEPYTQELVASSLLG